MQLEHEEDSASEKEPDVQVVQTVIPDEGEKLPGSHGMHEVNPEEGA
jgi:hypothetical protein